LECYQVCISFHQLTFRCQTYWIVTIHFDCLRCSLYSRNAHHSKQNKQHHQVFVERRDDVSTGEKVSADAFAALVAAYRVSAQRGASAIPGEISAAQSYASNASGGDGVGGNDGEGGVNEETDKSAANINAASTSANAAATTQTNKGRDGALLLAVMRGRSSEGADFRDAAARAVRLTRERHLYYNAYSGWN